jgi:hypothetical protein
VAVSTQDAAEDWKPTGTSTGIVAGVTLLLVALLLWAVPAVIEPTLIGLVGAGCLTASLWLVRTGARKSGTAFFAGTLTVPAAAGLIGGAGVAALLVTSRLFPVPSGEQVSVSFLIIAGNVGVFLGCVLALLGLALGSRNVLDDETLGDFVSVGLHTGVAPVATATLLLASAVLTGTDAEGASLPDFHLSVLLAPSGGSLHLADFLLLVGVAAGTVAAALRVLPVAELLADTGRGQTSDRRVRKAYYGLLGGGAVAAFLGLVALPIELTLSTEELRTLLGGGLFEFVRAIATFGLLRVLLVGVTALAAVGIVVGAVARTLSRDGRWTAGPGQESALPDRSGPVGAGVLVTVVAIAVADDAYDGIVNGVADQLPAVMASDLRETAGDAAIVYGEPTFVVLLAVALIGAVVGLAQLLRVATGVGYLSTETTGYSLASGGLFVGVVFAATLEVPTWLVLGGVVASLLVWDAGRFGTVLGREIGDGSDTRSIELVHAGGTALVGLAGAAVAALVASRLQGGLVAESPLATVALLFVVIGVLAFAAALR